VVVGKAAFMGFGATLPGNVLLTVAFAVFSLALATIDSEGRRTAGSMQASVSEAQPVSIAM
jgi:hypothetical protein